MAAQPRQAAVAVYLNGLKATFKQVPNPAMAAIESLSTDAVEVPHQPPHIGLGRRQHPLKVVAQLAVGQHLSIEAVHRLSNDVKLALAVRIVKVNRFAVIAARSVVLDRTGQLDAQRARHK